MYVKFYFSSRRRHTRCALVTGVQTCALPISQEGGTPNEELKAWTGQTSAPVAMLDDDRPRAHWSEVLILAEQLAAEPRLIPADQDERTLMFGLCHEICGDDGLGWNARLLIFATQQAAGNDRFRSEEPRLGKEGVIP